MHLLLSDFKPLGWDAEKVRTEKVNKQLLRFCIAEELSEIRKNPTGFFGNNEIYFFCERFCPLTYACTPDGAKSLTPNIFICPQGAVKKLFFNSPFSFT